MLDAKKVAELKAAHGESLIGVQDKDGTVLVFRKPKRIEYERWLVRSEKDANSAGRELAKACLCHPNEDGLDAVLDKYPALLRRNGGIIASIIDLAGVEGEVESKKL